MRMHIGLFDVEWLVGDHGCPSLLVWYSELGLAWIQEATAT